MDFVIRPARPEDEAGLAALGHRTWSTDADVSPQGPATGVFFSDRVRPEHVLVAVAGDTVVGWIGWDQPVPVPSNAHVRQGLGFAVDDTHRGRGVGRALMEALLATAAAEGVRRLTLRVLATNTRARRLYEAAGFEVEGILRGEFHLDGRDVDDILMARMLP